MVWGRRAEPGSLSILRHGNGTGLESVLPLLKAMTVTFPKGLRVGR